MQSVSSNAVANAVNVIQTQVNQKADAPKDYFNANTDRTVTNTQPVNIIPVQDCFWIISPNRVQLTANVDTSDMTEH